MGKTQSVQNRLNGKNTVSAEQIEWEKYSQCRMDSMEKAVSAEQIQWKKQSVQNRLNGKSTVSAEWIQWKKQSVQNRFNGKSSQCRMDSMEKAQSDMLSPHCQ